MILWTYNFNKIYGEQRDLEQLSGLGDFSFVAWSQTQIQAWKPSINIIPFSISWIFLKRPGLFQKRIIAEALAVGQI